MAKKIASDRPLGPHFLREWREYKDLSLEHVAGELNASAASLSRIETKLQPYSQELLEALAELYGCDASDLLKVNPLVPRSVEILEAYRDASQERKEIFHEILTGSTRSARRS